MYPRMHHGDATPKRYDRSQMLPLMTLSAHFFQWGKNHLVAGGPADANIGVTEESSLPEHYASAVFPDCREYGFLVAGRRETRLFVRDPALDRRNPDGEVVVRVYVDPEHAGDQIHIMND